VLVQHLLMRTKPLPIATEAGHPLFADSLELIDDLRKARMIGRPKEGLREIHADLSSIRSQSSQNVSDVDRHDGAMQAVKIAHQLFTSAAANDVADRLPLRLLLQHSKTVMLTGVVFGMADCADPLIEESARNGGRKLAPNRWGHG
jgi:hypothetical protein